MFNFKNIGKKIKILATVIAIIGSLVSIILGIILICKTVYIDGILWITIGPIVSWISCFVLYGFGQLVDNSDKLVENKIANNNENTTTMTNQIDNKTTASMETYSTNELTKVKDIIKHLSIKEVNNLKNKYKKWTVEISKLSTPQLLNIINNEQNDWEKEYIYLCCFELLEKNKDKQ